MKRIISLTLIILLTGIVSSIQLQADNMNDEVTIFVTSEKKMKFDMFADSKVVKGLTTPYEITFSRTDSHFIFKSLKPKSTLKIEVKVNDKTTLTADWPITVVIITNNVFKTFGME